MVYKDLHRLINCQLESVSVRSSLLSVSVIYQEIRNCLKISGCDIKP